MNVLAGSIGRTFRELWAMKISQALFVVSTIAWLLIALMLNLDVVEGSIAAIRIFGFETVPTQALRDPETGEWIRTALSLDRFVLGINQFVFSAAYIFGTLLGLFATAPLISGFLEPGRIDLLLSKPVSRWKILSGHILGVWSIVLLQVVYLVGAIWLTVSLKTDIWTPRFLAAIPLITLMFMVMYSVVLGLAVATRSAGLALVSAYSLMFFSGLFAAHDQIVPQLSTWSRLLFEGLYHALPNYIEVIGIMAQLASGEFVSSWYPLLSSLLFGGVIYAIAFFLFIRRDF